MLCRPLDRDSVEPADELHPVDVAVPPIPMMTASEVFDAADGVGGVVLNCRSQKQIEALGLGLENRGINLGKGLVLIAAESTQQVMMEAQGRMKDVYEPELFKHVAGVHQQCVGHLLKAAELLLDTKGPAEEARPISAVPQLEPR